MKEELQGLLLQAKQMEAEQKAKLTPIERSEDFEYKIGLLSGIKRIVLLIERHIERITDSQEVTAEELAEMKKSAMEFDGFLGFTVRGRLVR